jgi:serine protease DegQ
MRRVLTAIGVAAVLTAGVAAADWPTVLQGVDARVPRLEVQTGEGRGVCGSIVVAVKPQGLALTAAHCIATAPNDRIDLTLNGRDAHVVASNTITDLGLVRFKAKHECPVELADVTPPMGSDLAVVGFPFGWEELHTQFGHVARSYNRETKAFMVNGDIIFGDSGGAIIDAQGRLIGMTSSIYARGPAHMGAAVPIEAIRDFLDDYLPVK